MSFTECNKNGVVYMTSDVIGAVHCFSTRFGGVSEGIFESLNLSGSLGDDPERVAENYRRLCSAVGVPLEDLVFSNQVHRDCVRVVVSDDRHELLTKVPYEADGLVTGEKNVPLIIFTADCVPVLLHDPVRGVIGAVHSGWRGTALAIAGKAVSVMEKQFGCRPEDIRAAVGPCIGPCCYETGETVPDALKAVLGSDAGLCRIERGGRIYTDLKTANRLILSAAGVGQIDVSDECTSCRSDKYWSHRKTRGMRGSQAAVICMKG